MLINVPQTVKNWHRRCLWFLVPYLKAHWTLCAWLCPLTLELRIVQLHRNKLVLHWKVYPAGNWKREMGTEGKRCAYSCRKHREQGEDFPPCSGSSDTLATLSLRFRETSFPLTMFPNRHTPCGCGFLQFCCDIFCRVDKDWNPLICYILLENSMLSPTCLCFWSWSVQAWSFSTWVNQRVLADFHAHGFHTVPRWCSSSLITARLHRA